jgi:hypothetical protein
MARRKTATSAIAIIIAAAAAGLLALGGWAPSETGAVPEHSSTPPPPATSSPEPTASAPSTDADPFSDGAALAAQLPVIDPAEAAQVPEYRRETFGDRWADVDGNGCDQRNDVLARDLVDVTLDDDGCTVLSGVLLDDPYSGKDIVFQHDRVAEPGNPGSSGVQIEHIVSLAAAHRGGAWKWTDQQRLMFANDLEHVIAVDGPTNNAKNDSGPAAWLAAWEPADPAAECAFALRYTEIVADAHLAVERADRDALVHTLTGCGSR